MHTQKIPDEKPQQKRYTPPAIIYHGALKQFAGSPLGGGDESDSGGILDLPG